MFTEQAVSFESEGSQLTGILHNVSAEQRDDKQPHKQPSHIGVLIVVGGPQYRVGSHRQFVHLARDLAGQGIPTMRFDVTGMGDSSGEKKSFDNLDGDIRAAVDCFCFEASIEKVVLWGLCDGASAVLMYANTDGRIAGLVLANPWLENSGIKAKATLKSYYLRRLVNRHFWTKLLHGELKLWKSLVGLLTTLKTSLSLQDGSSSANQRPYQQRMLDAFQVMRCPVALILSGDDLTAKEFQQQLYHGQEWQKALQDKNILCIRLDDVDHTFSSSQGKTRAVEETLGFIATLAGTEG